MPKSNLKNLESKKSDAQYQLEVILKITENKQVILSNLLSKIEETKKTLEDNFSRRNLQLEREFRNKKRTLEEEIEKFSNLISELKIKEVAHIETNAVLEKQHSDLRISLNDAKNILGRNKIENDELQLKLVNLRADESILKNNINELKDQKKTLQNGISLQILENNSINFRMRSEFTKELSDLEIEKDKSKTELRALKRSILVHTNKNIELEEKQNNRDKELIRRENSLTIKLKAFAKEKEEFEIETRRWSYTKPLE